MKGCAEMVGRLIFARMYSDEKMEAVRADEASLSEMELEKRFSETIELLKCKAILNGELVPDMEKTQAAISAIEKAKQIAEEYGWNIMVLRENAELHLQIIPDSLLDIEGLGPLFESAYRVSVDHWKDGAARFHFRYPTHRYTGAESFPW